MHLSRYFLPVLKEDPSEAQIVSHRLMLRTGMVRQLSAGNYNWLPLGLAVLKNIENILREEMNKAGALELLMPTLQPAELWQESGRYEAYGKEMLRIQDRHGRNLLYGPTNEEVVTDIFRQNVRSYKELPLNLYHIQWKFRDEIRPRFGVMRGREFLMKDAYSFDLNETSAIKSYQAMYLAYLRTFRRLGLTGIPVAADTGPIGGNLSHEFHVVADTGESALYYDPKLLNSDIDNFDAMQSLYSAADEKHDPQKAPENVQSARGIEVGHIFYFGKKYSESMNAKVTGPDGKDTLVEMGSYGIGVSRLVGAIIEASHDEKGIIWPENVAPFKVGLINLKAGDEACDKACQDLYQKLKEKNISVLYDDRKESVGVKFATMDLIGLPWQIAIGPRGVASGIAEVKSRKTMEKQELSFEAALNKVI